MKIKKEMNKKTLQIIEEKLIKATEEVFFRKAYQKPNINYSYSYKDAPHEKRMQIQTKFLGFCIEDLYSLDITIAKFVLPRIRMFRDSWHHDEKFERILDTIIYAMEQLVNESVLGYYDEKVVEGCRLFGEYFGNLWT